MGRVDWTLVLAAVSAAAALGLFGVTARIHRRAVEADRRAQASRVAVWAGARYVRREDFRGYEPFQAVIHNGSDQPIYSVRLELLPLDASRSSQPIDTGAVSVIPPGKNAPDIPFRGVEGDLRKDEGVPAPPPLRLVFRDNAGIVWVRHPDGRLVELKARRWWWPWGRAGGALGARQRENRGQ